MYAELTLDYKLVKGIGEKKVIEPIESCELVDYLITAHQASELRSCSGIGMSGSGSRYQSKKSGISEIREQMLQIAERKPRWGFKKMYDYLKNQGYSWNHKWVHRIYRELGLKFRIKPKIRLPSREAKTHFQLEAANLS